MAWTFLSDIPNRKYIEMNPQINEVSGRLTLDYWEDYISRISENTTEKDFSERIYLKLFLNPIFVKLILLEMLSGNKPDCQIQNIINFSSIF